MTINKYGVELIKSMEKLMLHAYDDGYGYLTIGYGHISDKFYKVEKGATITKEFAEELLIHDIEKDAIPRINNELMYEEQLDEFQYSSLVSIIYNCGSFKIRGYNGKWYPSKLMLALNEKNIKLASELIKTFKTNSAGKPSLGLRRRRMAEYFLFLGYKVDKLEPNNWAETIRREAWNLNYV